MDEIVGTLRIAEDGSVYAVRSLMPAIAGGQPECEVQVISTRTDPRPQRTTLVRAASQVASWPTLEEAGLV